MKGRDEVQQRGKVTFAHFTHIFLGQTRQKHFLSLVARSDHGSEG